MFLCRKKLTFFFMTVCLTVLSFSAACGAKWVKTKGGTKFFDSAAMQYIESSWKKIDGKWFYFDTKGFMRTGRFRVDGKFYYIQKSTGRVTNALVGRYYYGKNGAMLRKCWRVIKEKDYYFGANGKMKTGQFTVGGKTYYATVRDGCVHNQRIGDYYYNSDGAMVKNKWADDFYYDKNGKAKYGKFTVDGNTYYCLKASGLVKNQWYKKNFYDEDGVMATNQWVGSGDNAAYVDANGVITKGNQNPQNPPTEEEIRLLAALTNAEAGNQSYRGKLAVASVIINRMNSSRFPNTIRGVIYQSGQFETVSNGYVDYLYSHKHEIRSDCIKAAKEVLTEGSKLKGYYFFNIYSGTLKIGDHWFS